VIATSKALHGSFVKVSPQGSAEYDTAYELNDKQFKQLHVHTIT
jgi:hypothetical protein